MMRIVVRSLTLTAVVGAVAACSILDIGARGGPYPGACEGLGFGERQCAAIVERARKSAELAAVEVASIDLLPPEDIGPTLAGPMTARVRFHLVGGDAITEEVWCLLAPIGGDELACSIDPRIHAIAGVDMDVPCSGEPPAGCATPPPKPPAAVVAGARPLRVDALDIPLDRLGSYEIEVGAAGLPDGYLTTRSLTLADDRPTSFWIEGGVRLEVRPVDPARPPVGSRYREPFDGIEPVEAFLVFEVTELQPGAVLSVRDIVVE